MPISGRFTADFSDFVAAVDQAQTKLISFEANSTTVANALSKMEKSFSGQKIIQDATLMAEAIERVQKVGGLTAAELQRAGAIADEAIEKMNAMGVAVPENLQKIADAAKKAEDAQKGLDDEVKESGGFFGDLSTQIAANMTAFISAQTVINAVGAAFHAVVGFVKDSINAYAEQESAEVKLTAALRQHSLATPEVITQYNQLATTFQNTTRYADEQINAMEALLTQVGGVMPSAMQAALKASTDLAAGLGIDLQSATMLVAKAAAGHTETLGRYGITVSDAELASKGFEAVLEAVNRQFGGQAQADVDTYAGKLDQMKNSWNNVEEALGKIIVQDPLIQAALKGTADGLKSADENSSSASKSIADLAADFGLIDRNSANVISFLGDYVGYLNSINKTIEDILKKPSPFQKMADDMAAHPITTGLQVANQLWKEHQQELKDNEAAAKKFDEAMIALNSVGADWRATLDTMNGAVVEGIRYYLEAGVEQGKIATAYGVTAEQVRAVAAALKDEGDQYKFAQEMAKFHNEEVAKTNKALADEQIARTKEVNAAILAELDAQVQLNKAMGLDAEGAIRLQTTALDVANQKMRDLQVTQVQGIEQTKQQALIQQQFTDAMLASAVADDREAQVRIDASNRATQAQKSNLQQIADATATTYQRALNDYTHYTDSQLQQLKAAAEQAAQAVSDAATRAGQAADSAFTNFRNTLMLDTSSLQELNQELTHFYDTLASRGMAGMLSGGYVTAPGPGTGAGMPRMPSFGEGGSGDFGSGTVAMLHGKEAIVPLDDNNASDILYGGTAGLARGGGSTINLTINVTQPLGTPDQIARAVGEAQVSVLKGQGVRLPYGT